MPIIIIEIHYKKGETIHGIRATSFTKGTNAHVSS